MSNIQGNAKKKKTKSMTIATVLVMVGLIFSKCSGLLRNVIVSDRFDAVYRDSFLLAFNIPDLVYNLLIGGSIQSAITPSLASAVSADKEKEGLRAVGIFISVLAIVLFIVCAIGVIFSEPIYSMIPGNEKHPETVHLAAMASKWLFPQIFFMMLAAFSIGVLNAYKRFESTAFGPTVYNIFVLLAILLFGGNSESKIMMTTAGIMGAAFLYFMFQFILGFDKLKQIKFEFKPFDPAFISLFKRALPILISASVVQINIVILNSFSLQFPDDGLVYALNNASNAWQLPYGIFAVAIGNVMLPSLAALYGVKKYSDASALLSSRLKSALFLTIPSAAFMFFQSTAVIKALFQWSPRYTDADAASAGLLLKGYCIAIVTHTVIFIMNQAFYAIGKTKIPLFAGAVCLISNPLFCFVFMKLGMGPVLLTVSFSLTSIIQMIILCVLYCRQKELAPKNMKSFLVKCFICALALGGAVFVADYVYTVPNTKIWQLSAVAVKGIIALVVYFAGTLLLRIPEATECLNKVRSKLKR